MARDRTVTRVHLLPSLGNRSLIDITPLHIRRVVATMTASLAPTTVRTNYGVLRAILTAAVEADLLVRSPCRGIRMPPHQRREVRFLSPHELERLADAMPLE
jgi:integrase